MIYKSIYPSLVLFFYNFSGSGGKILHCAALWLRPVLIYFWGWHVDFFQIAAKAGPTSQERHFCIGTCWNIRMLVGLIIAMRLFLNEKWCWTLASKWSRRSMADPASLMLRIFRFLRRGNGWCIKALIVSHHRDFHSTAINFLYNSQITFLLWNFHEV